MIEMLRKPNHEGSKFAGVISGLTEKWGLCECGWYHKMGRAYRSPNHSFGDRYEGFGPDKEVKA